MPATFFVLVFADSGPAYPFLVHSSDTADSSISTSLLKPCTSRSRRPHSGFRLVWSPLQPSAKRYRHKPESTLDVHRSFSGFCWISDCCGDGEIQDNIFSHTLAPSVQAFLRYPGLHPCSFNRVVRNPRSGFGSSPSGPDSDIICWTVRFGMGWSSDRMGQNAESGRRELLKPSYLTA
jgi:hypothetical protein